MNFFEAYNNGAVTNQPVYKKNSELPLFVPMKLLNVAPTVTALGPTHQINAMYDGNQIFFFLNKADHGRLLELGGGAPLLSAVANGQNPFVFSIRRQSGLSTLFAPHSAQMLAKFENKLKVNRSDIPLAVQNEIDFAGLAAAGIILDP